MPVRHNRRGFCTEIKVRYVPPTMCHLTHKEKPSPEYELLRSVSNIIDGREENGATLWSVLASKHDMTDEELLEIVEKFKELEV